RRRRGVIDDADVEIIRAVVFAAGGDGSLTITRREADLLLDLNRQTSEKKNAAAWQKLFVEAVGHHLMYPGRAPEAPDRAEALRRQRWLDERRGALGFIAEMGRGLRGLVKAGKATGDGPPPRDGDA